MENITIGEIGLAISTIVGLISGIGYLHSKLKKWMATSFRSELRSMDEKLAQLEERIDTVDIESCKNFLVDHITYIEKGSPLEEVEKERFWEQYGHYTKNGGNSYIVKKVEQLEKAGRL